MGRPDEREPVKPNIEPDADRLASAGSRELPGFLIIGTQRGGTTSLFDYLTRHPDVGETLKKEIHFFDLHFHRGLDWYRAHFPISGAAAIVGEASPSYLLHPEAPSRVHAALPSVTLIALLRNPIDRAWSHYQLNAKRGHEPLAFEEAIAREPERLAGAAAGAHDESWRLFSYLSRGLYADQLQRWLRFFPREQLLIVKSEDLYRDPAAIYDQTVQRLGLRRWPLQRFRARHAGSYAGMEPETRERLAEYFAPHNARLYEMLGRDLDW
jgi:hypothetical protein